MCNYTHDLAMEEMKKLAFCSLQALGSNFDPYVMDPRCTQGVLLRAGQVTIDGHLQW